VNLADRVPALLARARALLRLPGGPAGELARAEIGPAARAVSRLHDGLVGARALAHPGTYQGEMLGAYLLWWWPQNYARTQAALRLAPMPSAPRILDVGAGPGPAALAATDLLGGEAVAFDASAPALAEARELGVARTAHALPQGEFDLTIAANVLSEVPAPIELVRRLTGVVVLIEPALRETGRALLELRDQLLVDGSWKALAPCLTQKPCPALASPKDWCTAELRWTPPRHIVQLADATGLRADELLSFAPLILARAAAAPEPGVWRVVGVPPPERGKRRVFICNDEGRFPLVRLDKQESADNANFALLGRGDLVRLGGLERRGDGLRVVPGATVLRVAPTATVLRVAPGATVERVEPRCGARTTAAPSGQRAPAGELLVKPRLVLIVGPTASGKTALACELAEKLGAEIVSADSQQCYRGLDAGTAKPTPAERARAPHHLLDVADPEEQLDAAAFVKLADAAIADIVRRGRRAIVAGGTGLWVRALLRGLLDAPGASPEFRAALRGEFEKLGVPALHERLGQVDPEAAVRILPNDRVRIERALEVHALSGRPLSELQREHGFAGSRYQALTLFLDPPRELLHERIAARSHAMFETGALRRETELLVERGAVKALKIIGYGECAEALRTGDFKTAEERTAARTRQYAKRQRTWFAKDAGAPVAWPLDAARLCSETARWYEGALP